MNEYNIGDEVVVEFDGCYAEGVILDINYKVDNLEKVFLVDLDNEKYYFNPNEVKLKSELEHTHNFKTDDIVTHTPTNQTGKITGITECRLNIQVGTLEICDDISEFAKCISFPNDFYSWKDGVDVDNKQINKWIKEIQEGEYDNVSSGNTIVFKNGNGIVVAKNYWSWNDFE